MFFPSPPSPHSPYSPSAWKSHWSLLGAQETSAKGSNKGAGRQGHLGSPEPLDLTQNTRSKEVSERSEVWLSLEKQRDTNQAERMDYLSGSGPR